MHIFTFLISVLEFCHRSKSIQCIGIIGLTKTIHWYDQPLLDKPIQYIAANILQYMCTKKSLVAKQPLPSSLVVLRILVLQHVIGRHIPSFLQC
jgi:hypothetical protein